MKLEIIGFNIESCIAAQSAGADRIELCAGPGEGGTTPSYAFIQTAREKLKIDLYVMIRPRGGDFLYSDEDFEIMKKDVAVCKKLGCDGIVTGILKADGNVDKKRCKELIELAYPLEATFHRAFDRVKDPFESLEEVIESGFERILTSGLKPKAIESTDLLAKLIKQANERIIIMPGSGVNADNIISIAESTGAKEFHSSATISKETEMKFTNTQMKESLTHISVNKEDVKKMRQLLDDYHAKNAL
ncbi:MAG: copper homeostasis protein CutC [Bacteroidota bacterium]|nr:copper homeostasis protein CutC [Bacteroidota bacterium]